ncbi:DEAD/DEAH box helicase [Actinoallomurus sp. NPDC052274]|uniref:DEAD/DEAH box helicase n=1 Tax=Actinoallomurus sp. NPDC052274 TaxID=3155420 RepID=UPI0034128D79
MDVFRVHGQLIDDYRAFTSGAVSVRDENIAAKVREGLDDGEQWPDPWLSLNPSFASGGTVSDLVKADVLHPECERIFRRDKPEDSLDGEPMELYQHQRDAIEAARTRESYVLTTGTGSGKSLAYVVPIVDRVLRERGQGIHGGVKAIIVYPMNALANSQREELAKYLRHGYGQGREPVRFARYTGQETEAERRDILDDPPDILLTNYMMLELMLTRPRERKGLIRAAAGLRFLVLDELHTYRGRQGADVAMLVRRVRDACEAPDLQCVGTSATMASGGSSEDQRRDVADVASKVFGVPIEPDRVIGETLRRATEDGRHDPAELAAKVAEPTSKATYDELTRDPLARWIESTFGLDTEKGTGRLIRRRPTTIRRAAADLAALTGRDEGDCGDAIKTTLRAGAEALHPQKNRALFAFRLHQFLSKGETVYVSLESEGTRHITRDYQLWVPGEPEKLLLPLAFCRQCGQEYLSVARDDSGGRPRIRHRRDEDGEAGYLYISEGAPWPDSLAQVLAEQRLPDSWLTVDSGGNPEVLSSRRKYVPQVLNVLPDGTILDRDLGGTGGVRAAFIPTPFGFCLSCGVAYDQMRGNDFGKLARLDQEGRSSAVSVLSGSVVRSLQEMPPEELSENARKLLTFVDNRQDASLQAGHFNDFAQVAQLRGALYRAAVAAGDEGLHHENVAQAVAAQLGLGHADYAANPEELTTQRRRTDKALRDVVAYRLYVDLERGWRVTMPNLEQTGLISIDYADLDELAAIENVWDGTYGPLRTADAELRAELTRILLDEMRRVLAIDVDCLTDLGFEEMSRLSRQLKDPWALAEREKMAPVGTAFARSGRAGGSRSELNLSGRSRFGRYLRRQGRFPAWTDRVDTDDAQRIISDLLKVLAVHGLAAEVVQPRDGGAPGYRINAAAIVWRAGGGEYGVADPLRWQFNGTDNRPRVNPFFRNLYRNRSRGFAGLFAREHTAQVPGPVRQDRERAFRDAKLPLLYCSPTMELGVDIAGLNAVTMRNVPPTPANYAQRSGRAGRSGQAALVTTYCASGNSHDRYYFRRSDEMVAGAVAPPRLDLSNEDLIRSHVHAIWLAETDLPLGRAMPELIDLSDERKLALHGHVRDQLRDSQAQDRALRRAQRMLAGLEEMLDEETSWWDDEWLERVVRSAPGAFDAACERWRDLYRKAKTERETQHLRADDYTLTTEARNRAKRRRAEAETQLRLLRNEQDGEILSDFNPYRYLASEGFLPGYSFPRLPLAAYIPGRGGLKADRDGEYLQRSRFIAIREFGPGALIYHEGSTFQVRRVQVPTEASGEVATGEARRCGNCGYHHTPEPGLDRCEMCDMPLPTAVSGLMQLHTVFTERRERISSDEEERRRAGFELETSYRFQDHGRRKGRLDAVAADEDGRVAKLSYGDSATVRVANLGYRRGRNPETGFWLDTVNGRWLPSRDPKKPTPGTEITDEETGLAEGETEDTQRRQRVIPYVEDRRNILVLTLAEPVPVEVATSLQYALERGIEAVFQLEDSELNSEPLPPDVGPDRMRMLFIESAEGGAGVLRRLQAEPGELARVAREALRIAHFDPDTGADLGGPLIRTRCERGCYDCLLSFGNQGVHHLIDRRTVRDLLLRLAAGRVRRKEEAEQLIEKADSRLEGELITWLSRRGYRLPTEQQVLVTEAVAQPDYVYRLPGAKVAVFVDGPAHTGPVAARDAEAEERLIDAGWHVIRFRHDDDWLRVVQENRSIFGPGEN